MPRKIIAGVSNCRRHDAHKRLQGGGNQPAALRDADPKHADQNHAQRREIHKVWHQIANQPVDPVASQQAGGLIARTCLPRESARFVDDGDLLHYHPVGRHGDRRGDDHDRGPDDKKRAWVRELVP